MYIMYIDWVKHVISSCPCPIFLSRQMRQFCGCFTSWDGVARRVGKKPPAWKSLMSLLTNLICQQTTQTRLRTHHGKCQWKMWWWKTLFILEIWLIKVCMFCKFKENLLGSHSERPRPYLSEKFNIFRAENARIIFFVKNWFDHVTARLDFQLSEHWERGWDTREARGGGGRGERCRKNSVRGEKWRKGFSSQDWGYQFYFFVHCLSKSVFNFYKLFSESTGWEVKI